MYRSILAMVISTLLAGCEGGGDASSVGESPTGTYLDPLGDPEDGYAALDEICEQTDSPDYMKRFETAMFRDVAVVDNIAYLVDGSLLWTVWIADPAAPKKLNQLRLPGHPLALMKGPGSYLVIAAGEAGLLTVNITNAANPVLEGNLDLPGYAMDVTMREDVVYVPVGGQGLVAVNLEDPCNMEIIGQVAVPDHSNAVDVVGDMAYVAACSSLSTVKLGQGGEMELVRSFWVPEGHAKEIDAVGTELFVAGGEALFSFDAADPSLVVWTGYYNDPDALGFYVNDVVVQDQVAYIAAGDESVRSVDVRFLVNQSTTTYLPGRNGDGPPDLDGPIDLPGGSEMETLETENMDPIGIGISGDRLLVLGNFRWVGERQLTVMDISVPGVMVFAGSYEQPNHTLGIDYFDDHLFVHGVDGFETVLSEDGETVDLYSLPGPVVRTKEQGSWLYLVTEGKGLYRYSAVEKKLESVLQRPVADVAIRDSWSLAADITTNSLLPFNVDGGTLWENAAVDQEFLGFSRLYTTDDIIISYDWAVGDLFVFNADEWVAPSEVAWMDFGMCEVYDIADFYLGTREDKSILFGVGDWVGVLCPANDEYQPSIRLLNIEDPAQPFVERELSLPEGRYADIEAVGDDIFTVGFDNSTYTSTLMKRPLDLSDHKPPFIQWDGHANDLVVFGDYILVADGDHGVIGFRRSDLQPVNTDIIFGASN